MFKRVNSRLSCRFRVGVFVAFEYMFLCLFRAEIKAGHNGNTKRQYGYM